jgi:hypothetical protein
LERFQEGLPGMVFGTNDLGMFLQKGNRVRMDDFSQVNLHISSIQIFTKNSPQRTQSDLLKKASSYPQIP